MKKISQPLKIPEKPIFRAFEVHARDQIKYVRNLPHLQIEGATYFVTFRLADSIPTSVMQNWLQERDDWLQRFNVDQQADNWQMKYYAIPYSLRKEFERMQQRRYYIELNRCHGRCLLRQFKEFVAESIEFFHGQRVWIGDYVIMPNHVHVIVQPFEGVKLEEWLYSVKRFTAKQMRSSIAREKFNACQSKDHPKNEAIWQRESFDRLVRNSHELIRIRQYISDNPKNMNSENFILKKMDWLDEFTLSRY